MSATTTNENFYDWLYSYDVEQTVRRRAVRQTERLVTASRAGRDYVLA